MIRRSLILDTAIDLVIRTAIVFVVFLLFSGHNTPGGGFVAGLVAGVILALRYVASGKEGVTELLPTSPEVLLGLGLFMSLGTGVGGWVWGTAFLQSVKWEAELPILGILKTTSALLFDIGVFIVVVGVAGATLISLGSSARSEP